MKTNSVVGVRRQKPASPEPALHASTHFPTDLRAWIEHSALLRATQTIAQEADIAMLHPKFSNWASKYQDPWRMLTLVAFAYAIGLSEDRRIAAIAATRPEIRELFHGEAPSTDAIRHFCDRNRHAISSCLGKVILEVWCHWHTRPPTTLHPVLIVDILCEARARVQRACTRSAASEPECFASSLSGR